LTQGGRQVRKDGIDREGSGCQGSRSGAGPGRVGLWSGRWGSF
jgi:hypothetical protein